MIFLLLSSLFIHTFFLSCLSSALFILHVVYQILFRTFLKFCKAKTCFFSGGALLRFPAYMNFSRDLRIFSRNRFSSLRISPSHKRSTSPICAILDAAFSPPSKETDGVTKTWSQQRATGPSFLPSIPIILAPADLAVWTASTITLVTAD